MTATIHPLGGGQPPHRSTRCWRWSRRDMNAVNAVILDRMQSKVALIPELAGHLIAGGGKRMRPMLTLASAALLDYPGTRHHKLAAAVEFIHTATLLHDDVVDLSRNAPRQAHRQPHLGQSGQRAGRRFPVQPRVRADGRGRQPQGAQDPQPRLAR